MSLMGSEGSGPGAVAAAPAWGVIGQEAAVATLARAVAEGRPAHAYLFTGPPHAGKATLARRLAQALECLSPIRGADVVSPCLVCRACRHIEEGKHPDVELIAPGGVCDER